MVPSDLFASGFSLPRRRRAQPPPLSHRCNYPFLPVFSTCRPSIITRCENSKEGRLTVPALALTQDAEAHVRCRLTCLLLTALPSSNFPPGAAEHTSTLCIHARPGALHPVSHMHVSRSRTGGKRARRAFRAFSTSMLSLSASLRTQKSARR